MSYNGEDLELSSDFTPYEGEANFGPPITREVVGGSHIAPQCVTFNETSFVLTEWENGLPRHDTPGTKSLRFPHGLMEFGESIQEAVARLVKAQQGFTVEKVRTVYIHTELDDANHWHIEPIVLVKVAGVGAPPSGASIVRCKLSRTLPDDHKWAGKPEFSTLYKELMEIVIPSM